MEEENVFVVAAREKYRFPYRGQITAEDLYDLSSEELDKVFKALNGEKKVSDEASLLSPIKLDKTLENKIAIVRYVFEYKKRVADKNAERRKNAAKIKHLKEILADKQEASLKELSEADILKMIDELKEE